MQKIIAFCLVLFLFMNIPSTFASEGRFLKDENSGYGYTPSYEEDYGSEPVTYGGSSSSGSGSGSGSSNSGSGSSNSGSGNSNSGYGSGYGSYTPAYEEKYEEEKEEYEEEKYEEKYEEEYEEEEYEEEKYEEEKHEEKYEEEYEEEEKYEEKEEYEEEKYEEDYEEKEEYESPYNSNNNYGGYGSMTPSYEEEYESSYEGYGNSSSYEESTEEYTNNEESETETPEKPFVPTSLLTGFVVDIHFLAGDPRFQYIAYHYCSELYPGYTQCDIYNGTAANSKMVATEIVVSAAIFAQLPMQERKYWHSHAFAVKSGLLVAPGTPADKDLEVMASVMNSYGKVTDFFHSYQSFPYGGAKLAYGLAEESQINETIAQEMDKALGLSTTWKQRAESRKSLNPTILEGADDYLKSGEFPQYVTKMFPVITEDNSAEESPKKRL